FIAEAIDRKTGFSELVRMLLAQAVRDQVHFCSGLIPGDIRAKSREDIPVCVGNVVIVELLSLYRRPQRDLVVRVVKVLRHYPDHDTRISVDEKSLPDDRFVSAESRLPQRVAQDDRRRILLITLS